MSTATQIQDRFQELQAVENSEQLRSVAKKAFDIYNRKGIPTSKNEEWKYTRINNAFNKDFSYTPGSSTQYFTAENLKAVQLPGHDEANAIVFINGFYSTQHSVILSEGLEVLPLKTAASNQFSEIVSIYLGDSNHYLFDGIHALNTAFAPEGVFVHVPKGKLLDHPIYCYYINDARSSNILAQPRNLVYVSQRSQVQIVETFSTIGLSESFTNQVLEIIVEEDALVELYKIQNDAGHTNQVSTTHFRQIGKSMIHAVTVSLNGGMVRNNLNMALAAEHGEAHMYGLYFLQGNTHVDNHTVVDNIQPHCFSNELYKGIVDDHATAVFNGKIFVQPLAQKTNAFQSNKNVLMSDTATVNTKPQLEIFADDVKCSHGCTVGRLDEEGLFYLRSRGISEKIARSLLIHSYAIDILDKIKLSPIRDYVDELISKRLEVDIS